MNPKWYPMAGMPFDQMWTDVRIWFPLFLKGSKFVGHFKVINKSQIDKFSLNEIPSNPWIAWLFDGYSWELGIDCIKY